MSDDMTHPCPTPRYRKKVDRDGDLWACTCGRVYVLRFWFTYAGEGYEWKTTELHTALEKWGPL